MPPRSPLDFDVSVGADKRRRQKARGMSGEFGTSERTCEWAGCNKLAKYRAPRSRVKLDEFHWFCLEHVRQYNSTWNYYAGLDESEIEESRRADAVWDRPTWTFGEQPTKPTGVQGHAEGEAWKRFGFKDPFEVLGEKATLNPGAEDPEAKARVRRRLLPANERRALDILGAGETDPKDAIRRRFKEMVKDLHPDMNGGDRSDEDRLREVLWAWDQIKGSPSFRD